MLLRICPVRMQLAVIFLNDNVVIILDWLLAIFVMIDTLPSVAFRNSLSEDLDCLDGYLSFTSSLFHSLKKFDWIFCTAALKEKKQPSCQRSVCIHTYVHW